MRGACVAASQHKQFGSYEELFISSRAASVGLLSLSLPLSAASSYELVQIANIYKDEISYFINNSQLELVRTCTNYNLLIQPNTKF